MTRTTPYRVHTNRASMDYRSGIQPMPAPSLWRAHWRQVVLTTAALLAVIVGVPFALGIAAGWAS